MGKLLKWYNLQGIVSENDIKKYIPYYEGKMPDWTIFTDKGVILLEPKFPTQKQKPILSGPMSPEFRLIVGRSLVYLNQQFQSILNNSFL